MLRDLLSFGSLDSSARLQLIMNACVRVFVIFCVLPIHEYAHARAAYALGDQTAKLQGRMTLQPTAHIDPIGALMIFLVGFGYAKPVPVNIRNFKNRKRDMALTSLAGPVSNLLMAFISLLLMNFVGYAFGSAGVTIVAVIYWFFFYCAMININLAVFNLIPVPPLDGSRIATAVLPDRIYYKIMQYERYIMIAVLILLFTGILSAPLSFLSGIVLKGLNFVAALPYRLFFG